MGAPKGHPRWGPGRAGIPNKRTTAVAEAIGWVFNELGGEKKLLEWANTKDKKTGQYLNLTMFYTDIWVKMLPLTVRASLNHGINDDAKRELAHLVNRFITASESGGAARVINGGSGEGAYPRMALPGSNGSGATD